MDAAAARTQKFCADQPAQQEVRTALLRAEKDVHQGGWDGQPKMFFLQQNTRTHRIRYTEFETFPRMLSEVPGRTADILDRLAEVYEFMRRQVHVPAVEIDQALSGLPLTVRDIVFRARANPDADLFDITGRNWRFHGVGMACEAWMALNDGEATEELVSCA
ncbi:hypothetical protein [Kutzneria sp. 744]|uniref:hypothetical protein n=1 Tax=Kutzneria sp. (strain 744) TaxID=345341 RepID=UPI0012FC774B|nr:hypothetical protein [Kutzneria sp. 744]